MQCDVNIDTTHLMGPSPLKEQIQYLFIAFVKCSQVH